MKAIFLLAIIVAVIPSSMSFADSQTRTAASSGVEAYIISPKDGETVSSPVLVQFGLKGMGVAPAGTNLPQTGHHHLIIDENLPDLNNAIPSDNHHRHFGGGQTETEIELAPGKHTLQLLLGDYAHIPHQPPVTSEQITINVK
jgi:hypothetical protein